MQLKLGNSADQERPSNEESMTTVASADGVGGTYTFKVTSKATGRYIVIWFTKMPPGPRRQVHGPDLLDLVMGACGGTATSGLGRAMLATRAGRDPGAAEGRSTERH